ncbi:MAG: carbamate kinase [Acidobacteriota bacterium]
MTESLTVVAFGGNALVREGERGGQEEQLRSARTAAPHLVDLVAAGAGLLIVHGNGPQVGNELRRMEEARDHVPSFKLDVCVAHTQGSMGYFLEQSLLEELSLRRMPGEVVSLITLVVVEPFEADGGPATKPVGPFFPADEAARLVKERNWKMVEDSGRGYRRVVPSPSPVEVLGVAAIAALLQAGNIVIAGGGGGIPVRRGDDGRLEGVEAVIDKDRTASLLAMRTGARQLLHLTSIDAVYADFPKPTRRPLQRLTVTEARALLDQGQFPAGSMGPKIESSCEFLAGGGRRVLITSAERLPEALAGKAGTVIVP